MEKTYDYIINAGMEKDDLEPALAYSTKDEAIREAQKLNDLFYEFTEVVYMPEDDVDTNEVIWRSWEAK